MVCGFCFFVLFRLLLSDLKKQQLSFTVIMKAFISVAFFDSRSRMIL